MKPRKDAPFVSSPDIKLRDIDYPHITYFPWCRKKRMVTVQIEKWYGVGQHYHVTLSEEENYVWNPKTGEWTRCKDDYDSKKRISAKFRNIVFVKEWIDLMVRSTFPEKTHRLVEGLDNKVWHYREGD